VSEHILHKPGKLTPEEYEQVKTHANLSAEFLETARRLRHLAPFVRIQGGLEAQPPREKSSPTS